MTAILLLAFSSLQALDTTTNFNLMNNGVGDFRAVPYYGQKQTPFVSQSIYNRSLFFGAVGGYDASSYPQTPLGGSVLIEGGNNMVYGVEYLLMSAVEPEQETISHGLYVYSKYHIIDLIIGYNVEFAYDLSVLTYIGSGATVEYTNYFSIASFTAGVEARYMLNSRLSVTGGYKNLSLLTTPHIEQHHLLLAGIKLSLF